MKKNPIAFKNGKKVVIKHEKTDDERIADKVKELKLKIVEGVITEEEKEELTLLTS